MSRWTIARPSALLRSTDRLSLPFHDLRATCFTTERLPDRIAGRVLELDDTRAPSAAAHRHGIRHGVEVAELHDRDARQAHARARRRLRSVATRVSAPTALPQSRGRTNGDRRRARESRDRADLAHRADARVLDLDHLAVGDHLRMVERLFARAAQLERNVVFREELSLELGIGLGPEPLRHDVLPLLRLVGGAEERCVREAVIVERPLQIHGPEQRLGLVRLLRRQARPTGRRAYTT